MVTIVSGLPRSGTSMMMRMLAAGGMPLLTDDVRAADPDNPHGYFEYEPVKNTATDPSWLDRAEGKAVKMVYKLLYDLPPDRRYRVVFTQRALKEVVASQNAMLGRLGRANEAARFDVRSLVGTFAAEVAAIRSWLTAQPAFAVHFVNYNALLAEPAPAVAALVAFLGGGLDTVAMLAAIDPALYRQRSD
jgi:LPS sulfotransferase NodH